MSGNNIKNITKKWKFCQEYPIMVGKKNLEYIEILKKNACNFLILSHTYILWYGVGSERKAKKNFLVYI